MHSEIGSVHRFVDVNILQKLNENVSKGSGLRRHGVDMKGLWTDRLTDIQTDRHIETD